jgi:hypothetical protein
MYLKVIARVREIDKDALLLEEEPEVITFLWKRKYIPIFQISDFWELEVKETIIRYEDDRIDIINENVDRFAKRLEAKKEEAREKGEYPIESDVECEIEEEEEDTAN